MKKTCLLFSLAFLVFQASWAQGRFDEEVQSLKAKYDSLRPSMNPDQKTVVFVGSSSIRMWKNVEDISGQHNIINTGFGGSTAKDLLGYTDPLILDHNPDQVFIYEGDNDIFMEESLRCIMRRMKRIVRRIKKDNPDCQVVLISAKPSLARWSFKEQYQKLNKRFYRWSKRKKNMEYADVWKPMLDGEELKNDLFIEDNLHMNDSGYQIWKTVLQPYLIK